MTDQARTYPNGQPLPTYRNLDEYLAYPGKCVDDYFAAKERAAGTQDPKPHKD